jgi:hypothetical protein
MAAVIDRKKLGSPISRQSIGQFVIVRPSRA